MFPKDDDILLEYLYEDGQKIEPTWLVLTLLATERIFFTSNFHNMILGFFL